MLPSVWDASAAVQDRHWWFVARREIVASVLSRHVPHGASLLDVGCGTGFVIERLMQQYDIIGIEPDAAVRARAADTVQSRIVAGSALDLTMLGRRTFDALLMLDVLEHIQEHVQALISIRSRLSPGGVLLLTVPAYPALWSHHDVSHGHFRRYSRRSLRATLTAAGLEPVHLTNFNARLLPLALLTRMVIPSSTGDLRLPPRLVNRIMTRVFVGESAHIERGYPFGLSLMTLARLRTQPGRRE